MLKLAVPNETSYSQWARELVLLAGIFFVAFIVFLLAGLNIIKIASANVYDQQRVFGLKAALGGIAQAFGRGNYRRSCRLRPSGRVLRHRLGGPGEYTV